MRVSFVAKYLLQQEIMMTQMTLPFPNNVLFQTPIIAGREPDATDLQRTLAAEQSNVLSETVNLV